MENLERFAWTIAVIITLGEVGLVPSFDGKRWRLHGGPKAEILWEGEIEGRGSDYLR
jgi:hypothetical protein